MLALSLLPELSPAPAAAPENVPVNVVREMKHVVATSAGSVELALPEGLTTADVTVVLLVQNTHTHAIAGAAQGGVSAR